MYGGRRIKKWNVHVYEHCVTHQIDIYHCAYIIHILVIGVDIELQLYLAAYCNGVIVNVWLLRGDCLLSVC